jgi:hypothetical protein
MFYDKYINKYPSSLSDDMDSLVYPQLNFCSQFLKSLGYN